MEGKFSPAFCFPENGDSGTLKQTRSGNSHQHDMTENETFEKVDFHEMELDDEYYDCVFVACDFSKLVIRNTDFEKCEFRRAISRWPASREPSGMLPLPTAR